MIISFIKKRSSMIVNDELITKQQLFEIFKKEYKVHDKPSHPRYISFLSWIYHFNNLIRCKISRSKNDRKYFDFCLKQN